MNNIKQALEKSLTRLQMIDAGQIIFVRDAIDDCKAALTDLDKCEPQQQWVGLSDAEIVELCPYIDHDLLEEAFYRGARAVEKKLKQLNTKG